MIRFTVSLLVAMLAIAGVVFLARNLGWIADLPSFFVEILLFLFFSTLVIFAYLHRVAGERSFVQIYILTTVLKLLGYALFVLFVVLSDAQDASRNALVFIGSYFVFTALEIGFLYRKIVGRNAP